MKERFCRTAMLIGALSVERLQKARVAVFGIGGVGSFAAEALARAGIGHLVLVDPDKIAASNLNRQLVALKSTLGKNKAAVMKERVKDIDPMIDVDVIEEFFLPERAGLFFHGSLDYIVDAIDTVTSKIGLVMEAKKRAVPIVSSMGTANKLDPTKFEVADIYETSVCPLARVMRRELKARGVQGLKVVYSKELPKKTHLLAVEQSDKEAIASSLKPSASISFVPSVAGLILAGVALQDLGGFGG